MAPYNLYEICNLRKVKCTLLHFNSSLFLEDLPKIRNTLNTFFVSVIRCSLPQLRIGYLMYFKFISVFF